MIDEVILHVGMHKTGSSSIQDTLHNLVPPPDSTVGYLRLNSPNHSGFLTTLLSERPEEYHTHRLNGRTATEVQKIKQRNEQQLKSILSTFCGRVIVISGENLSAPSVTVNMLMRLKELLLNHCRSIRVIGYVRPPVAYMQSAFQQRLKGGVLNDFEVQKLWPHYCKRFKTLDQVFGEENVDLVPFKPESLYRGDVVLDFAQRAGITLKEEDSLRTNESISREACAVLFTLRKLENIKPYPQYTADNNLLIEEISRLGCEKLVFDPEVVLPVMEANRSDLEWINRRLGKSIEDAPNSTDTSVSSEEDLLRIAITQGDSVWRLLEEKAFIYNGAPSPVELIDRLNLLTAQGSLTYEETNVSDFLVSLNESDPVLILEQVANFFTKAEPEVANTFQRMVRPARAQKKRLETDANLNQSNN